MTEKFRRKDFKIKFIGTLERTAAYGIIDLPLTDRLYRYKKEEQHAFGELDDLALKLRKLIQSIRLLRGKVRQLAHNGTHPSAKHSASPKAADMTRFSGRCW